jgi:hypothetical protein
MSLKKLNDLNFSGHSSGESEFRLVRSCGALSVLLGTLEFSIEFAWKAFSWQINRTNLLLLQQFDQWKKRQAKEELI